MFQFLLLTGLAVLAVACRTFEAPLLRRAGALLILVVTYLLAWFLTGDHWIGVAAVIGWFFLPWVDILTRIRHLRLPLDKKLRYRFPPSQDVFPYLAELTEEVEQEGFEQVEDTGWQWEGLNQFMRIFYNPEKRMQAAICMHEQGGMAFAYFSLSSRADGKKGKLYTTWNYPFAYTMKTSPKAVLNRAPSVQNFGELVEQHQWFLIHHCMTIDQLKELSGDSIQEQLQLETRQQVDHNLSAGLITLSGNGTFRYSWRGCVFLWLQFVKDMVRFS
jgi:hypothetical protein